MNVLTRCFVALCALTVMALGAQAQITGSQQSQALKEALLQGAERAIGTLGTGNGFYNTPQVKIPLPGKLEQGARVLKMAGLGKDVEKLEQAMNLAASQAVAQAKPVLVKSVTSMTVTDAAGILRGGEQAGTQYFRQTSEAELAELFKPIVARQTAQVGLAAQYNKIAVPAAQYGLIDPKQGDLDSYVTAKALDGLYYMIAEEEKAIRKDPMGQASKLLQSVFGVSKS